MDERERTHCRVDLHAAQNGQFGLTPQQSLGLWALKWAEQLDNFLVHAPEILKEEMYGE